MLSPMACVIDWPGTASFVRDVIVSIATVVTATVAVKGINKWRAEESGKADFELSRRVGRAAFRLRDVLANARRNIVTAGEFPEGYKAGNADEEEKASAWAHIFEARWTLVRDCAIEIQSLRNEAEALWGREIVGHLGKLLAHVQALRGSMEAYIANERSGGEDFKMDTEFGQRMRAQVFDSGSWRTSPGGKPEPNQLTSAIEADVDATAAYLRTKLPHRG